MPEKISKSGILYFILDQILCDIDFLFPFDLYFFIFIFIQSF